MVSHLYPGLYKILIFVDNYRGIKSRFRSPEEEIQRNDDKLEEINEFFYINNDIYLKNETNEEMNEITDINNDTYLRTDLCEEITWDS